MRRQWANVRPFAAPRRESPRVLPDGMFGHRNRLLKALAIPAGIVFLVNIFTWHGEFWAAWPLLFLGTAAAFIWSRGQGGAVQRFGPAVIISAMLIGINIISGSDSAWAKWPILAIAIATAIRWATSRSKTN